MSNLDKLLNLAKAQIGYQEKADAAYLDDPDANAGRNNYTKYSRDVDSWGLMGCQGQPWCCTYQFWLEAPLSAMEMRGHWWFWRKDFWQSRDFIMGRLTECSGMGCFRQSDSSREAADWKWTE